MDSGALSFKSDELDSSSDCADATGCADVQSRCCGSSTAGCSSDSDATAVLQQLSAFRQLTTPQRRIIFRIMDMLDTDSDSVVITNPLGNCSPIVYVTKAWQDMCGYSMREAVGQNPRLTQGEATDQLSIQGMRTALLNEQACKVRLVNYRGYNNEPFWNCLSVQPIFHENKLVLFAARLRDYAYQISRLVSHRPLQFCNAGDHHQRALRLTHKSTSRILSRACRVDVSEKELDGEEVCDPEDTPAKLPTLHVRRLGFFKLDVEPEYLLDRLMDECYCLGLNHHVKSCTLGDEVLHLEISGNLKGDSEEQKLEQGKQVHAAVSIVPEDAYGTYSISITRLKGDTFDFHALYRTLRSRLVDLDQKGPKISSVQPEQKITRIA